MKNIILFLRKIGILKISKGDFYTGEFQNTNNDKTSHLNISENSYLQKILNFSQYLIGAGFLLLALMFIFSDFISGILFLIVSLLTIPLFFNFFTQKLSITIGMKTRVLIAIVSAIMGVLFISPEIKIYEFSILNPLEKEETTISEEEVLIRTVYDFQDAQLSTIAVLSVRFETAEKQEYIRYLKEVNAKWEKVLDDVKDLKRISKNSPKEFTRPIKTTALSELFVQKIFAENSEIDFGDGYSSGGGNEGEANIDDPYLFTDNVYDEAFVLKRIGLTRTANEYLQEQLNVTAKGAQDALATHESFIKKNWDNVDKMYENAASTAKKIAYTSKISFYAVGSVASFGAAAAATSGTGVILGYMSASAGVAIAGADIALDISEGASTLSTGKGLVSYKKDKQTIGKINELHMIANLPSLASSGGKLFSSLKLDLNDVCTLYGYVSKGVDMHINLNKDSLKIEQKSVADINQNGNINNLIQEIGNPKFEYNDVITIIPEEKEEEKEKNSQKKLKPALACSHGESVNDEYLKVHWPSCNNNCAHLENSCIYKDHCICKNNYNANISTSSRNFLSCITDDQHGQKVAISFSGWSGNMTEVSDIGTGTLTEEQALFMNTIQNSKLELRAKKAINCEL